MTRDPNMMKNLASMEIYGAVIVLEISVFEAMLVTWKTKKTKFQDQFI